MSMEPGATSASEPDHDNSSLQNPSTNPAEAGTTDETSRDEEHETSSIEALNWSEVDEEELAAAQQAETLAALAAQSNLTSDKAVVNKSDKDEETGTVSGSSGNEEGSVLSTSLLQSINSSASDEDRQAKKLSVIENWASEVSNAVERGEIEMTEDFADENDEAMEESGGVRKRKGKKSSSEMLASMTSSVSTGESSDPLSHAPVLDDGPIWNKGPRSYTFQENRRFNQKLTFCLLIAVVLAIGLGLGNLVAHQECEAEFKASLQSQNRPEKGSESIPTPTTPRPIIPDRSTDSSSVNQALPKKQILAVERNEQAIPPEEPPVEITDSSTQEEDKKQVPLNEPRRRKQDEPVIEPKYQIYADTVSSVVQTLDKLSRKIDQFENNTRKLQGVLMIPEESANKNSEEGGSASASSEQEESTPIDDLINAIEEDVSTVEKADNQFGFTGLHNFLTEEESDQISAMLDDSTLEARVPEADTSKIPPFRKLLTQLKEFEHRFVKKERKSLRDSGKYKWFETRRPDQYSEEEKSALQVRYRDSLSEFLKLLKNNDPQPIEFLFGPDEEEQEERKNDNVFASSPKTARNSEESQSDPVSRTDPEDSILRHESQGTANEERIAVAVKEAEEDSDDLIITQVFEETPHVELPYVEDVPLEDGMIIDNDNHIVGKSVDESESSSFVVASSKPEDSPEMPLSQKEPIRRNLNELEPETSSTKPKNLMQQQKTKNVETSHSGESNRVKGKGKKVNNVDSNKAYENIKGKNVDKRRGASSSPPDAQQRKGKPVKDNFKKQEASKHALDESTNTNEDQAKLPPKLKPNKSNHEGGSEPAYINGKQHKRYQKSRPSPNTNEPYNFKDQKKKQQQWRENSENQPRYPKTTNEEGKFSYKDPKNRQQKPDSKQRNNDYLKSASYQTGKKAKSWQSREKVDKRDKSRERGSSWGN